MLALRVPRERRVYATALVIVFGWAWLSPWLAVVQSDGLTVTVVSPASGSFVRGTIVVTARPSDDARIVAVRFLVDGEPIQRDMAAPYSIAWDTATVGDGLHTLRARARYADGGIGTSAPVRVTVDNSPPTVGITTPSAGAIMSGVITFAAAASDTVRVDRVVFLVDGTPLERDTAAPYSVKWDTTTAGDGAHTLRVRARDAAGNTAASARITVTIDNTPPAVNIIAPAPDATVDGVITVAAGASDSVGVIDVQFFLDAVPLGVEDTAAPYSVQWDTTTISDGPHVLTARSRDAAAHAVTSAPVTVIVANTPPVTTLRVEESSSSVSFLRVWTRNFQGAPGGWSGGSAAFGVETSARALLNFSGTGVSWIGLRGPNVGIANVYVDGTYTATVDGYAPANEVQAVLFTSHALTPGPHMLAVEVTRTRNAASSDFIVNVDAFDVTGARLDTVPAIAITSPADGTDISGTTTITASAQDEVGVAGVQFVLDGAPLGDAVGAQPYAINWDSTTVAEGTHTLTAVARNSAGNTATSAPVSVIVANDDFSAAAASETRFEETDPAVVYTSGTTAPGRPAEWWQGSRSRGWSVGTAAFNRSNGGRATFTFTGTSVSWIGFLAPWAGIARVYVDGVLAAELDLYSPVEQVQVPVFTATELEPGAHTVSVESTGLRNAAGVDYAVVVDAFDVSPPSPLPVTGTRFEESAASTTFTGGWIQGDDTKPWSSGTAAVSATPMVPGARATFTFVGTRVSWVGLRGPQTGIARIYLDGAFQATVDTYSPAEIHSFVYSVASLAAGTHTFAVEVTGQRNPAAVDSLIYLDAFDIRSRMEDTDASLTYSGAWTLEDTVRAYSGTSLQTGAGTAARSANAGLSVEFVFTGTSASWIGLRAPWAGLANVFVDGTLAAQVDLYSPAEQVQVPVFAVTGLPATSHTLRINVTGARNPAASAAWVVVDAFDTVQASPPAIMRVQETHPAVALTADWSVFPGGGLFSGDTSRLTVTAGGRATYTFSGTAVRWLGESGFATGVANVSIDGTFRARVDTKAFLQEAYQVPLFTATGLTSGTHTLTIEAIGRNNEPPGSPVERVVVDAFDVY